MLAVYRIGVAVPTPGIDGKALAAFFEQARNTMFGLVNLFSGGALERFSIFALGIMPYISASIILQLLTVVIPYLERLSKEGEAGRRKITQYTRYGTVLLSVVQGLFISVGIEKIEAPGGGSVVFNPGWSFRVMSVLTLTAGTVFIMWLGEQISERGIGNGISLIIFAGIVVSFPSGLLKMVTGLRTGSMDPLKMIFLGALMVAVIAFIVFVERGQRRIPVSYAKRVVGRKVYGGQSTHLPLRVNTGGVIPIIFAASVITIPVTIAQLVKVPVLQQIAQQFNMGMPLYNLFYVAAIIFFTYFYISIIFNPVDVADNLRKYGGFIPGIRPGKNTSDYIDEVLSRITLVGAVYLAVVAILPEFLITGLKVQALPWVGTWLEANLPKFITQGLGIDFLFGGTSILIVVGVAMDTMQQIEAQLVMRHYDGFMRRSRIRGRRG
jgi:preprotein translocase subunit SecY